MVAVGVVLLAVPPPQALSMSSATSAHAASAFFLGFNVISVSPDNKSYEEGAEESQNAKAFSKILKALSKKFIDEYNL